MRVEFTTTPSAEALAHGFPGMRAVEDAHEADRQVIEDVDRQIGLSRTEVEVAQGGLSAARRSVVIAEQQLAVARQAEVAAEQEVAYRGAIVDDAQQFRAYFADKAGMPWRYSEYATEEDLHDFMTYSGEALVRVQSLFTKVGGPACFDVLSDDYYNPRWSQEVRYTSRPADLVSIGGEDERQFAQAWLSVNIGRTRVQTQRARGARPEHVVPCDTHDITNFGVTLFTGPTFESAVVMDEAQVGEAWPEAVKQYQAYWMGSRYGGFTPIVSHKEIMPLFGLMDTLTHIEQHLPGSAA